MESIRKLWSKEERLLEFLISRSSIPISENWRSGLLVRPMDDGGMGSLCLFPNGEVVEGRVFGQRVSDYQFTDLDGVVVIASLNLDNKGNLFELDIWKTDFSKLIAIPDL